MLTDFNLPQARVRLPCLYMSQLVKRNTDFHGRADILARLEDVLLNKIATPADPSGTSLKTFALCGPGGIGKTQLAAEFYHRKKTEFDAAFWISADTCDKVSTAFSAIAVALGLENDDAVREPNLSRERVKDWLREPSKNSLDPCQKGKWLIVFDNVDDPDTIRDFWPEAGPGSILITSRDPLAKTDIFSIEQGADMNPLSTADAAYLLCKLLRLEASEKPNEEILDQVVAKLDCFPLAIVQMAGIIRRRHLSLEDFLQIYDQEIERVELHSMRVGTQHDYMLTLASTWGIGTLSPGAKRILEIISLLDPDSIQRSILTTNPTSSKLAEFPVSKGEFSRSLSDLTKASVVRCSRNSEEISVHRIIQDVVRAKLAANERSFAAVFNAATSLISSVWPYVTTPQFGYPQYQRTSRWASCDTLMPHITCLWRQFQSVAVEVQREIATVGLMWLLAETAWYYIERSDFDKCREYVDAALVVHECASMHDRTLLAEIYGYRGIIAFGMRRPEEALEHIQTHMDLRLEALKEDPQTMPKVAAGYSELGKALLYNGLFTKAQEAFTKSIQLRSKMPNFTRLQLFNPLRGLGWVYWYAGEIERAAETFSEALRDREQAFGPADREGGRTGSLLFCMGCIRAVQGQLDESFRYHQRALLQFRSTIGDSAPETADACYKVATHYIRFSDWQGALKLLDQAISIYNRVHYSAPDLARAYYQRSRAYLCAQDLPKSKAALEQAWTIRRKLVPLDTRLAEDMCEADFDDLVVFWSR